MKLVIAGKRTFYISPGFIHQLLSYYFTGKVLNISEIVSGGAPGVDFAAKSLCENKIGTTLFDKHFLGKYIEFSADWEKYGKTAGPIRNREMAKYGDALLLIWDGESRGSANMKKEMEKLGKPIYEVILKAPKKLHIDQDEL